MLVPAGAILYIILRCVWCTEGTLKGIAGALKGVAGALKGVAGALRGVAGALRVH